MYVIVAWVTREDWTVVGPYKNEKEAKWCLRSIRKHVKDGKAEIVSTKEIARLAGLLDEEKKR